MTIEIKEATPYFQDIHTESYTVTELEQKIHRLDKEVQFLRSVYKEMKPEDTVRVGGGCYELNNSGIWM